MVTKPKYEEVKLVNAQISEYKFAIEKYDVYNANVQALLLKKNSVDIKDREKLDALIPEKLDTTQVLANLGMIASKSNLSIESVEADDEMYGSKANSGEQTTEDTSMGSEIQHADVTITLIGRYSDFKNFLKATEESLTLMDVVKLSLAQMEGETYKFVVGIRTYALPLKNN